MRLKSLFKNILTLFSDLSLPLVIGSVCTYSFIAKIHGQTSDPLHLFLLGSAVFTIYLLDHLSDSSKSKPSEHSQPFYLLYRFRKLWLGLVFLLVIVSTWAFIKSLHTLAWQPILYVLGGTLLYFLIERLPLFSFLSKVKEVIIALVLTLALGLLPAWDSAEIDYSFLLLLFLLSFQSINIFSWVDYENDLANGKKTLATEMGLPFVVWANDIFALITLAIIGDTWSEQGFSATLLVFILMELSLISLRLLCEFREPKRVYRFWADMVFVLPVVYFLLT